MTLRARTRWGGWGGGAREGNRVACNSGLVTTEVPWAAGSMNYMAESPAEVIRCASKATVQRSPGRIG